MDNDDQPIGQVLTRREVLRLAGLSGAALLAACAPESVQEAIATATATNGATSGGTAATQSVLTTLPSCVVRPALTEGPYFVDELLLRSDIRSDPATGEVKEGKLLALTFQVSQIGADACTPLPNAIVDIWHCDAAGQYSDVSDDPTFGDTAGQKFLRGYQLTDENGLASFLTIYPGWYRGRTVHIHFKVRTGEAANPSYEFTSQLFFDDGVTDVVYAEEPYAGRGERSPRNDGDGIYANTGQQLLLNVEERSEGYAALFDIGLQMS